MRFIISIGLLISVLAGVSQSGKMIVDENRIWSTLAVHCLPNGTSYSTYFISLEGDTIIDGLQYSKMWYCDEPDQVNWMMYGFIREDADKKVYLRAPDYIEGMVYDFGCSIGDTLIALNIYLNNDSLHYVVSDIDSVLLLDGYKKRISLYEYINQTEEVWVEGLGSYYGILNRGYYAYGSVCGGSVALCFKDTGSLIYQNPDYSTCYYASTVGLGTKLSEEVNIYPNPAKDFVNIEVRDNKMNEIIVYGMNGKNIFKKIYSDNKIILNLHEVDKGIYFVQIISNDISYPPYKLIVD
jgi:hypothetical protein